MQRQVIPPNFKHSNKDGGGGACAKYCLKRRRVLGTIIDVSPIRTKRTEFSGETGGRASVDPALGMFEPPSVLNVGDEERSFRPSPRLTGSAVFDTSKYGST